MYQHIMVPLDGSELAECVLSHVEMIAKSCSIPKITLIRVVPPLRFYGGFDYSGIGPSISAEQMQQIEDDSIKTAKEYLARQLKRLKAQGIDAEAEVSFGIVNDALTNFAEKHNVDLIVIATHGRSGISRMVMGSNAEKIMRTSRVPVLMVRPQGCGIG